MEFNTLPWVQILSRVCTKCGHKRIDHAEEPPYDCEDFDCDCDAFSDIPNATTEVRP